MADEIISGKVRRTTPDGRPYVLTKRANGKIEATFETNPEELSAMESAAQSSGMTIPGIGERQQGLEQAGFVDPSEFSAPPAPQVEAPTAAASSPVPEMQSESMQTVKTTSVPESAKQAINQTTNAQVKGLEAEAKAEQQKASDIQAEQKLKLSAMESLAEAEAVRENAAQASLDKMRADYTRSIEDLRNSSIDSGRFLANQDTAGKIAAAVAIGLGAVGAAMSGGRDNEALKIVNAAIDRDIQAQQADFDSKKAVAGAKQNLFGMYMQQLGDARAAGIAAKTALLEKYNQKLEIAAGNSRSSSIAANFQKASAAVQSEKAMKLAELDKRMVEVSTRTKAAEALSPSEVNKAIGEVRNQVAQNKPLQAHLVARKTLGQINSFREGGLTGLATIQLIATSLQQGSFGTEMQSIADRVGLQTMTKDALARFAGSAKGTEFLNQATQALQRQIVSEEQELGPILQSFGKQAQSVGLGLEDLVGASVGKPGTKKTEHKRLK
jgi:hypothetical protein